MNELRRCSTCGAVLGKGMFCQACGSKNRPRPMSTANVVMTCATPVPSWGRAPLMEEECQKKSSYSKRQT